MRNGFIAAFLLLAGFAGAVAVNRATDVRDEVEMSWTWPRAQDSRGHPFFAYRWQLWSVEDNVLLQEGTTRPQMIDATVIMLRVERPMRDSVRVFLRVDWISTKGRVSHIGTSPHRWVHALPLIVEPPPVDTTTPAPEPEPDSTFIGFVGRSGDIKMTVGDSVQACHWFVYRPRPDEVITLPPPEKDQPTRWEIRGDQVLRVGETNGHCAWLHAIKPIEDLHEALGLRKS
jgi:hypothetical protein